MRSTAWKKALLFPACAIFLSSCATDAARLKAAEAAKAEASAIGQAAEIGGRAEPLPALPEDCRTAEKSRVKAADRVDVALVKYDAALGRANERVLRCAAFFEAVRGHQGGK